MPRRASSNSQSGILIAIIGAVVLLGAGAIFLLRGKSDKLSGPALPIEAFRTNANSLRGNVYSIEGTVQAIYTRDSGKLIHLKCDGEDVFTIIPSGLETPNIERQQDFRFKVEIKENGTPEALAVVRK